MKNKILRNIEWGILVCTILLIAIGLVALFSSTQNSNYDELKKQILWLIISIPVMIITIVINYEFLNKISPIIYGITIIALIAVLFTEPINGASCWFSIGNFTIQPSEFAKIATVLFLAQVIVKFGQKDKDEINRFWKLCIACLVVIVPVFLLILEPDYGTSIAFISALVFMLFVAGIRKRYIITAVLLVVILVPVAYFFVLPEHAKTRIDVFLNPNIDPRGAGYNIIQSKLAIGAGEAFGMGLLKGNQTQLRIFVP